MNTYTEEQQKDFQERAGAFQTEFEQLYAELKMKHQVEKVYGVATVPSPSAVFGLGVTESLGDLKYKSVPSPLSESIIKES